MARTTHQRPDGSLEREATDLLRTMIRNACVNDGTPASGQEVRNADALEAYFAGSGLTFERYTAAPGRVSLITRIEGSDRAAPTLLLMGHTDVVPANAGGWQRDPFGGDVVDGIVWGRGATDMLHITATMAVATRRLATSGFRPRGTLIYLGVADEEAGGTYGAKFLVDEHGDAVKTDYVITESGGVPIPAPDGVKLPVTVAEKGINRRRLIVKGTPGHGSMPFRTDNALVTASDVVRRIAAYQPKARILDEWRRYVSELGLAPELTAALTDPDRVWETLRTLEPLGFARFAHACTHTTFSPNLVSYGGSKSNVIPDRIAIDVDIRALPDVSALDVDAMLREALGDVASRVEIEAPRGQPGTRTPLETPLAESMSRVTRALVPGSTIIPRMTSGGTDARYFRFKGVPSYGFALHSQRIPYTQYPLMFHGNDERIDTESLGLSAAMWEALVRDFLG
ncbi:MAG: M20/M25/M40 family metallo-hydrolase [Candidatus Rokubacteria bacterium]|nr:M20/M25/M40 family metallo-hydrolase [Candidatus Rokubacteria bacterium]